MLHSASVNTFYLPVSWPREIDLIGFKYKRIENKINEELLEDNVLDKLKSINYAPQPYVQYASVLRNMGHNNLATDVIIAKMNEKREHAAVTGDMVTWLKLSIFKYSIGYGYAYYYSLGWALLFVVIGFIALWHERRRETAEDMRPEDVVKKPKEILEQFFYSINMLLPIIQLNKEHEEMKHKISYVRYYFYIHQMVGYALAMAIVAGLSGMLAPEGF